MTTGCRWVLVALAVSTLAAQGALAQRDTVLEAGAHYRKGAFHRWLFGGSYRDLWTAPLRVPVLDLGTFGGGLTPTTAGGGFQTKSLRFNGADGYRYGFRSVDKDPAVLPAELTGTFVEDLVRDQTSAQFPASPAVVAALLEAVGIMHTNPQLVVLPDDERLGEHRERFAHTLGYVERRAIVEPGVPPFAGATEIIEGPELFALVQQGPENRLDVETFLYCRLFDLWIGDWDRHQGNWGFARFGDEPVRRWVPVPEDRDQAFVRFDGLMLSVARVYAPQLVNFGKRYSAMVGLTWNGRELDRRFLVALEWPVWDSVLTSLMPRLTDAAIDAAVRAMPPEHAALEGERLRRVLRARREALPEAAARFYRQLADQVAITGTDVREDVRIEREPDGVTRVSITSSTGGRSHPYFERRFRPEETRELRLYLEGGPDRVTLTGAGSGITLRIVGDGEDVVDNQSGGGLLAYGDLDVRGTARIDRRPFVLPPRARPTDQPPRDWGRRWRSVAWGSFGPNVGLFLGGGRHLTTFGFRKVPYAASVRFRGGFSTGAMTGRADLLARLYRTNSRTYVDVNALVSGIEVLRFYGVGNETEATQPTDYYRVAQREVRIVPELMFPAGRGGYVGIGPVLRYSHTIDEPARVIAALQPYGSGGFGQIGVRGRFELDTRDVPAAARRGVRLAVGGSYYPAVWDVQQGGFGEVHGEASTYLTAASAPMVPTLAFRAGGKRVWGTYPYQEAAFLGDAATARLGAKNRFGGDAAVYGNAELRLQLSRFFFLLPGHVGVFGLGDVGRVFLRGESSSQWHWAVGGGLWVAYLQRGNTLSVSVAKSRDAIGVYVTSGFAF